MPPSNKYDKKKKENQKEGEGGGTKGEPLICCVPADKVFCQSPEIEALSDAVKCTCSSGKCSKSGFMHTECFAKYEEIIVGYMSKAGRGRTWNDKQRYSNVWANKGYDLVFKSCVCDCGHGSLRKDVDWVAPKAVAPDGAVAQPAEKKKKKEKAVLKPKLNFAVQNVSGSYYGSNTREEQEEGEDKPAPSLPSMRAFVREQSMELAVPISPGPPASIPGLASLLPSVRPRPEPVPPAPRPVERTASQASLASTSTETEEPGWITVSKASKERSDSGSRRNSVHTIKQREAPAAKPTKQRKPSGGDSSGPSSQSSQPLERAGSNASSTSNAAIGGTLRARASSSLSAEAAKKLKNPVQSPLEALATSRPTPSQSPFTAAASFPSLGLPMFGQPQASTSSFSAYSTPTPPPSSFYTSAYESALTYSSKDSVAAKPFSFGSELGARPKAGQKLSSSPEDIYQSDDEDMHRTVEGLLKDSQAVTAGWEEAGGARSGTRVDAEREMEQIWEQTQYFEQLVQQEPEPEPAVGLASGKRDANGFIHCNSCKTTHNSTAEFTLHCRTGKHLNNTMLAKKMSAGAELGPVGSPAQGLGWEPGMSGWEAFGQSGPAGGTWDPAPALPSPASTFSAGGRPAVLSAGASRADTPERRPPDDEAVVAALRAELDRERAAKAKAVAEVAALQSGKRLIEKQALIVENTLKAEEAKVKEYKELSERLSRELKRKEFSSESSGDRSSTNPMAGEVDRLKMKELEAALAAEGSKSETNGKVIKKLKEKVERVEKVAQREKDSRLLAEKTAELAGREQNKELAKRKDLENRLAKMEEKMKEEMRKRISTELDMKSQKEDFEKRAEAIARENASLEAAAEELMKQKDEVESKSRADLDTAEEALQARGNGEDVRMKIFQECEDIVKKSLAKAVENTDDVDDLEEVKMIFKMVNQAVQNSSNGAQAHIDEVIEVPEVAGIVESFKAGLEEMRMCVENDENKTSVEMPETKEDEKITEEHEVAEVETVTKAEAETVKKAKQPKIVDIKSCSSDDDQETKEETSTAVEFNDVGAGEVEDPFDKLLPSKSNPKTDESQVESSQPEKTANMSSEQEKQFDQVEEEKPEQEMAEQEEDGKEASESWGRSQSSTSEEVAGLDRHPKLGLDHEIDPYLGSPTVSRSSTPEEELEKDSNQPGVKQDPDETLKAEEDALTEERGEKEKQQSFRSPESEAGEFESPSGSPATSSTAWPAELSDSSTSGIGSELKELLEEPGAGARLHCLESNVAELQHMLVSLGNTVRSLTDQADESNYKNLVLNKLVEEEKSRSGRLERAVESASARSAVAEARMEEMAGKHSMLERRMSQKQLRAVHGALETSTQAHYNDPDELSGMKDSLLELLGSCENFQKGFDDMTDQQNGLESQQKALHGEMEQQKAKQEDLHDQFGKLSDKFASLNLECQVDKGTTRQQMEQLGYSIALLTTKLPSDNFPSHKDSSTSGIKSQDSSEADTNPVTPPPAAPSAEAVKSIVSSLVFANEQAAAADPKRTSCSPKPLEKNKPKQETAAKSRKLVYAQTAVNHLPQPTFPGMPGLTTWMSPDGSMMAVPPAGAPGSLPAGPGAGLAARPPLALPYGLQGRALGQMGAGPYPGPPTMIGYPLGYQLNSMYYAPPR